jgi:DNA-binding response OmpR family regulator
MQTKEQLVSGNLQANLARREVTLDTKPLALKPKEYDLLIYLMQHPSQVLTRQQLLEQVWGWSYISDTHTVDVHIHWLRELIEEDPQRPLRIVTMRGSGYRFEG